MKTLAIATMLCLSGSAMAQTRVDPPLIQTGRTVSPAPNPIKADRGNCHACMHGCTRDDNIRLCGKEPWSK